MEKEESFAAPPPMAELGNYKGVMLCNRPTAGDTLKPEASVRPFRSAIPATVGEPLGLHRKRPEAVPGEVKSRGPSAALRRHCRWVKELQQQVAQDAAFAERSERDRELKQQRLKEVFQKQREAIRLLKLGDARAEELTSALNPKAKLKPLWALTEGEREDQEEQAAGELINFAEALDYDEYIHDLEFRECLLAITDRAKKLQREQQSFKESLLKEFQADEGDEAPTCADACRHAPPRLLLPSTCIKVCKRRLLRRFAAICGANWRGRLAGGLRRRRQQRESAEREERASAASLGRVPRKVQ
ncbi:unnamed protein product [Symbiodinium natans]|uniref:Uncharacterized protein n=1 Tax=Symbiodinium natans TaxID=878477 RepID=A0A812J1N0_9DINO|nr:unnamed protein product [Symbiodinium natans]